MFQERHIKAIPPSDSAKPSAFAKSQTAYSLCDGYKAESPRTSVAPLFHPAFGRPEKEDAIPDDTVRNIKAASAIYPNEDKRRSELNPISDVLGVYIQAIVVNSDKTPPDDIVEFLIVNVGPAAIMLEEDKNENGDGGSDLRCKSALHLAVLGLTQR
jgi:hypothetical protein